MKKRNKTFSSQTLYPQFAFRISSKDKALLMEMIEKAHERVNSEGTDTVVTKNQILMFVLKSGLSKIIGGKVKFNEES